jgi:hypothetical protein
MKKLAFLMAFFGVLLPFVLNTPAQAQASRTWVSGVGDDANPCSRTAPCKTFAGAISKTAPGGEIDCLDPGGFGAVTITKSITIDCRACDDRHQFPERRALHWSELARSDFECSLKTCHRARH